jgi:hypothetical protein
MVPLGDVGEHHGREYRGVRAEHLDECARLLVSTFNAEPWNQRWTLETAQKKLAWTLGVPGFMGLISLAEGIVAFAAGYRQHEDRGEVSYLSILCVGPEAQGTGVGIRFTGHREEQLANGRYHGGCQARHSVGPPGWTSRGMPEDVSHPPLTPTPHHCLLMFPLGSAMPSFVAPLALKAATKEPYSRRSTSSSGSDSSKQ